ncbi:MAG TPA: hypothetical protein VE291_01720 [Terracidiphilus sp.]|jgi:hypothetical protein|nr:hypothetical protein [Terracidiphilus sp.]
MIGKPRIGKPRIGKSGQAPGEKVFDWIELWSTSSDWFKAEPGGMPRVMVRKLAGHVS